MKRKFKILCVCLTLFCLLALPLPAFADEATDDLVNEETAAPEEPGQEGVFEAVYSAVTENSEKILSLLAFIGTVVIAAIYKKGLLPGIRRVSGMVGEAIKGLKEENEKLSLEAKGQSEVIESLRGTTDDLCKRIETLTDGLSLTKQISEQKKLSVLLNAEIDMLREIFLSSSLPQYRKEAVEARIKEMKERLNDEEVTEE